ncbi:MAG: HU family DNA-binding protein [Bacteroidales bacterium]|nr:integration host factor subunit beta [Bacteroidales bacterium]MBS3774611.1 integration host factor subunit beta [Bacteroidales bacterium]
MTKADIVNEISQKTGVEKVAIEKIVEGFMESVRESMIGGQNVYLRGFGSFIVQKRAQKKARDIGRNKEIVIPEHYIPSFRPSRQFTKRVKENVK